MSLPKADPNSEATMTTTIQARADHGNQMPLGNRPPRQPQRHLDAAIASSIADAKTRSGLSWRRLAALSGVSHPHLVLLSQGRRVPSMVTAERIIAVLPMSAGEEAALRDVAVVDRGKSRPRR